VEDLAARGGLPGVQCVYPAVDDLFGSAEDSSDDCQQTSEALAFWDVSPHMPYALGGPCLIQPDFQLCVAFVHAHRMVSIMQVSVSAAAGCYSSRPACSKLQAALCGQ
jgi:hypothetical protein